MPFHQLQEAGVLQGVERVLIDRRLALRFLKRQRPLLEQAASVGEFDGLLLETETTLLGETANWFSRRSNTGVT